MSEIGTITVGNNKYNVVQASAMKQKTLMSLIGARISLVSAKTQTETIDKNMIYGLLLSLTDAESDEVAGILLHKTMKQGGEKLITVDDFQNDIHSYFFLLAEALMLNLKDFFTWLDEENAKQRLVNLGESS